MRAVFEVVANGTSITRLIRDRVLEIRITDKPGLQSDELEIKLDDRGGAVAFPPKGATLAVKLGWEGKGLVDMGAYVVAEITIGISPRTLTLRGRPANMRAAPKTQRSQGYEFTTLKAVVGQVAARNGWEAACSVDATIPRADQCGESDIHFLTRLARAHNATATVKENKLIVLPRGASTTASGAAVPVLTLRREELLGGEITFGDRSAVAAVRATHHDAKTGLRVDHDLANPDAPPGVDGAVHVDRHVYPSPETAQAAAASRLATLNRGTARGNIRMLGRGDIAAERVIRLVGIKSEADGNYLIETVTHTYSGESWITEAEMNGGNTGKANVGQPAAAPTSRSVKPA